MKLKHLYIYLFLIASTILACSKSLPDNPYDAAGNGAPTKPDPNAGLDPTSFQGIHAYIFQPTCANSGCHDGTFEPDFRTIESAYNSLVYQHVIKNDSKGTYVYRVLPGNADKSVIINRLTKDIDGQSGVMPLVVEANSDYPSHKDVYINNIRTWINNGAKDQFGRSPQFGNKEPQISGVYALANGTGNLLQRNPGKESIRVPNGTSFITVWVAFSDDSTNTQDLTVNKFNLSKYAYSFVDSTQQPMTTGQTNTQPGYFGTPVLYTHYFTINTSSYSKGATVFFRVYVKDPQHSTTEIPQNGSADYYIKYCSFVIQ